ncbi:MAG: hypothetical protein EKK37_13655 [Sphingobacteriales bacterium]|nr:MAG: hypothetical protein EKK37_13655 [Sphingobacteriales bacterium]
MKTLKFVAYLFYRYYSKGGFTKKIPYFSTISALTLLAFIHFFQLMAFLKMTSVIPTDGSQFKISNYFKMGLFMLPFFLFLMIVIKEADLNSYHYEYKKIKISYIALVLYIILSFSLLMFLAIHNKGKL